VKITGSDTFKIDSNHMLTIYDGFKSENKVLNYISGDFYSVSFNQITTGQIMEIVFER
jgi:hypothetical protein